MKDAKVYCIFDRVVWYSRRGRCWLAAPMHAYQTAAANAGWPDCEWAILNRLAGYLVTDATPEEVAAVRGRK